MSVYSQVRFENRVERRSTDMRVRSKVYMKKSIALIISLIMILGLTACGSSGPSVKGEKYDAGNISSIVPEGWMLVESTDVWGEYGELGHNPNLFAIYKGAKEEMDIFSAAVIEATYYKDGGVFSPEELFDDVERIPEQKIGEYTWNGFRGISMGRRMVYIYTGKDAEGNVVGDCIGIKMVLEGDFGEFGFDDDEAQAFIHNIRVKNKY